MGRGVSRLRAIARAAAPIVIVLAALVLVRAIRKPRPAPPPPPPPPLPAPEAPPRQWPTPFSVDLRDMPPASDLPPGTTRILVLGDSVARFLGLALRYRQDEARTFVASRGVGQCSIFEAKIRVEDGKRIEGTSCSKTWTSDVAELRPDVTLIVQGGAFLGDLACDAAWLDAYEQRVLHLVRAMGGDAGRVVIARVPYPIGRWRWGNMLERVDCFNRMLDRTARAGGLPTLDVMKHVCPTTDCIVESQGQPIRPDGLHFDGVGAEETARWCLAELVRVRADRARVDGGL